MHPFRGADDCIDWARLDAQRAADAKRFIDDGDPQRSFGAVGWIQRQRRPARNQAEFGDAGGAARWTLVDLRLPGGDRCSVGTATGKTALGALGLRKDRVDAFDERVGRR